MKKKLINKDEQTNIYPQSLEKVIADRFGKYSKYTIQDRALPDVRDGLKPVQRRILYSMYELGLYHNKPYKKSARVVGEVIGKYHPHGDTSIYDALIRLAQEWKMNIPLIEVHGNKGSIDDDPAAAMRYTEARLSHLGETMMANLGKKCVKFAPNFDDSEIEPTVLPTLSPNLLINGAVGIASGYATEMPPHNLGEIVNAIIAKIKNPQITLQELNKIVKGPDFPTGGIVQGTEGIEEAFATGSGKISIKAKIELIVKGAKRWLKITELPYGVIKSRVIRQIDEMIHYQQINGIKDIRDESDRHHGMQIIIELNNDSDVEAITNYLLAKSDLQIYYSYNNVVIKNRAPVRLGLHQLVEAYLDYQKKIQTASLKFDLTKNQNRHEIVLGLIKANELISKIIPLIQKTSGPKSVVVEALMKNWQFSKIQAEAITELKLYRLSNTDQSVLREEQKTLEDNIAKIKKILSSSQNFNIYLIELLTKFRNKFNVPRRTQIQGEIEKVTIDLDALIKHEDTWLGVSHHGYIKRFSNRVYEGNSLDTYTLKQDDGLIFLHKVNTVDKLLLFTSKGRFVFLPIHKIDEVKWKDFGKHLNDYVTIAPNELVVSAIVVNNFDVNIYCLFITKYGKGKRVALKDLFVTRFSRAMQSIKLSQEDELVNVILTNDKKQVIIITKDSRAVRYSEKELPIYGLNTSGVRAINLAKDDYVVAVASASSNSTIGLVSNRGGLKRMRVFDILPMGKNTKGKHFFRILNKNPHQIIDVKVIEPRTDIYVVTSQGNHIINFKNIPLTDMNQGFSLTINQPLISANIMHYNYLNGDSILIKGQINQNSDDDFNEAEEVVNQLSQMTVENNGKN